MSRERCVKKQRFPCSTWARKTRWQWPTFTIAAVLGLRGKWHCCPTELAQRGLAKWRWTAQAPRSRRPWSCPRSPWTCCRSSRTRRACTASSTRTTSATGKALPLSGLMARCRAASAMWDGAGSPVRRPRSPRRTWGRRRGAAPPPAAAASPSLPAAACALQAVLQPPPAPHLQERALPARPRALPEEEARAGGRQGCAVRAGCGTAGQGCWAGAAAVALVPTWAASSRLALRQQRVPQASFHPAGPQLHLILSLPRVPRAAAAICTSRWCRRSGPGRTPWI